MIFSIIIPVYNVEKYLNKCIDSIIHNIDLYKDSCEIILVNDVSTDGSGKICEIYSQNYSFIKLVNKSTADYRMQGMRELKRQR